MNSFCRNLGQSLSEIFNIEVHVFVSKKEACSYVFDKTFNIL